MSKYIDADQLRKEIDRLKEYAESAKKEWNDGHYNQNAFAEDCRINSFNKLLSFLDTLQEQPSLPSDLDEAAEEWCKINNKGIALSADKKSHYLAEGKDAFKAGAEWMAGQGWISVDEKLPEMDEEVIVLRDKQNTGLVYEISFGHLVDTERCIDYNGWNVPDVKFWMPMPKIVDINTPKK